MTLELVTLREARTAVAELVPRLTGLLRSVPDPGRAAVGGWSVGDVAAHLTLVSAVDLELARGRGDDALRSMGLPPPRRISEVAAMNAAALAQDPVRAPAVLASRIEASTAALLDLCDGEDRVISWLCGIPLPLSAVCSHFVSELALHGRDVATGAELDWRIDRRHARIAIEGCYVPVVEAMGGDGPHAHGDGPTCEIRLRSGNRFVFAANGSGLTVLPPNGRVDLHISADPVAMLLVMAGRSGRVSPALRGRMVLWGRRPVRALRMLARVSPP